MNQEIHDELDDFEVQDSTYEVWAACYDKDDKLLVEQFVYRCDDPDDAVTFADSASYKDVIQYHLSIDTVPDYIIFEVETMVDTGEAFSPAGTIFRRKVVVDKNMISEININEDDLEFTDDGYLYIRKVVYPIGTVLKVNICSANACARSIIYKVIDFKATGILCEFFD